MITVLVLFLTAFFYFAVGMFVFSNDWENMLKKRFFYLCLIIFGWSMITGAMNIVSDPVQANSMRILATPFWSFIHPFFLYFIFHLSGREEILNTRFRKFLFYMPAVICILVYGILYTPAPEMLTRESYGWAAELWKGKGFIYDHYLDIMYLLTFSISFYFLAMTYRRAMMERERKASRNLMIGIFVSLLLGGVMDLLLPQLVDIPLLRLGPVYMFPAILSAFYSIVRYNYMDINPRNVLIKILQTMEEGLILTEGDGQITYVNREAMRLLDRYRELEHMRIEDVLPEAAGSPKDRFMDLETTVVRPDQREVPVYVSKSTLRDEWDDVLGVVFVFRDMTAIRDAHNELRKMNENLEQMVSERTLKLQEMNDHLKEVLDNRRAMQSTINRLSNYDLLTNLPNRNLLVNELTKWISEQAQSNGNLAVLYFDINRFRLVNESLGHSAGDKVLADVAMRLKKIFSMDELIARMGADEFVVVIRDYRDMEEVDSVIAKVKGIFEEEFSVLEKSIFCRTSMGIALYPNDAEDAEGLLKSADMAMHKAKDTDYSAHRYVSNEMKEEVKRDFRIRNDLVDGLRNGDLELYYQPQVDCTTGLIIGNEALIRWNHKELGFLSPGIFIPIAERYGLMSDLDDFVMMEAARQNKAWADAGILYERVSVNLSPKLFMSDDLIDKVKYVLEETGLSPSLYELELTEGVLLGDIDKTIAIIEKLHNMGVRISIDDFGTEYSSLNYLKMLPVDRLKIAKPFVDGIQNNTVDEAIIDAIVVLANKIGMELIAEGVEEHNQMIYLRDKGCRQIQGYYYYKPMSVKDLEEQGVFAINEYKR